MSEPRPLNAELMQRLHDVTAFLESHEIEYALAGGLAVAVWGEPRTTYDIDFVVASSEPQIVRLKTLVESSTLFAFEAEDLRLTDLSIVRAHLLTADGKDVILVDFLCVESEFASSLLSRRIQLPVGGQNLFVVSPEDLLILKLQSARAKDLEDARGILREQSGELDLDELRSSIERYQLRNVALSVGLSLD